MKLLLCASLLVGGSALSLHADFQHSEEEWRKEREKGLTSELGWLSVVDLIWLEPGANSFEREKTSGTFVLKDGQVVLTPDAKSHFLLNGKPLIGPVKINSDERENPDVMKMGRLTVTLLKRGKSFALRVKDPQNPARAQFKGLKWFPVQESFVAKAQFKPFDKPRKELITNAQEMKVSEAFTGVLTFELSGKPFRLTAQNDPKKGLFVVFADQSTGKTTYPAGRFLDTDPVAADGSVTLDFNKAYSPPCAVTKFATCPRPLKENKLDVQISAGERFGNT